MDRNVQESVGLSEVQALSREHDRTEFVSGNEALDNWLKVSSSKATKNDTARTYVICAGNAVIGYYVMCTSSMDPEDVAPLSSGPHEVSTILLAKLAVHSDWQRRGIGEALLMDSLRVAAAVADSVAASLVVVDAIDEEAAVYYEVRGFKRFASNRSKLYLTMKSVRETLRVADSD